MQVVTSEQGCVGIIALTGRIDATTASSFETSCRELLDSGAKKVVVDLGGVEYISSAGLRVILTMVKASKAAAATLAFCSMQSMVAEVFKISGFSSMLPIYATRDEAVSVPASLEQLANVNAFIHETIPSSYRPLIPQVELAAEELLVNVFSYAYPDVPGEAQVACREVRLDNVPYFCFKVQDWGAPFDPFLEAPVPDVSLGVDERPVGGLGIHLIKSVVAHYTYAYYEQSNIIELYFALPE